jgi:uncharacterized protein (TIGR00290 family)
MLPDTSKWVQHPMPPKAFMSWSSGKDSAFAFHEARRQGIADIVGVLTTMNEVYDRVAMHGVRRALLDRQIAALGVAAIKVPLPSPCPYDVYETRMAEACATLMAQGITHMIFGDLYLQDIRAYREEKLKSAGMSGIFPLWQRETRALALDMIASGLEAHLVCVDPRQLDPGFAGRRFDHALLRDLPECVDPCGENGEFHTVVTAGPMFSEPISVSLGEVVEHEGFVFADVIPP